MRTITVLFLALSSLMVNRCKQPYPTFTEKILDSTLVKDCWMKSIGDLNGDGVNELIAGGHESGGIWAWYSPHQAREQITGLAGASTDAEVADIDNDGDNDLVAIFDTRVVWFQNPGWKMNIVRDSVVTHDIVVADLDGDHMPDIAARNQGEFGYSGAKLFMFKQINPLEWRLSEISIRDGEGLEGADINNDGLTDLVINGSWFENTADILNWKEHEFSGSWNWKNAFICCSDLNNDGLTDILLSPSELKGSEYRISWFESPGGTGINWKEHVIIPAIETVVHSIGSADFNKDGRADIVYARMTQGADPDEVAVLFNNRTDKWEKEVISTGGSHSMRIADIDGDGDPDIFGANWNDNIIKIWINNQRKDFN
jgi:hypothetical protein